MFSLPLPAAEVASSPADGGLRLCVCPAATADTLLLWRSGSRDAFVVQVDVSGRCAKISVTHAPYPLGGAARAELETGGTCCSWRLHSADTADDVFVAFSPGNPPTASWYLLPDRAPQISMPFEVGASTTMSGGGALSPASHDQPSPIVGIHDTGDAHTGVVVVRADGSVAVVQQDRSALAIQARLWGRVVGVPITDGPGGLPVAIQSAEHGAAVSYFDRHGQPLPNPAPLGSGTKASHSKKPPPPPTAPKHGKVDPKNAPHSGGNTWAGGTGGSDTAGLGGRGGPYRLDAGHEVSQVDDEAKASVSAEARALARRMAKVRQPPPRTAPAPLPRNLFYPPASRRRPTMHGWLRCACPQRP